MKEMRERYIKEFLDMIILSILRDKPMCGFDIIEFIRGEFGILLSAGSVYPVLHSFVREKTLKTKKEGRKKVYMMTEMGRRVLDDMLNSFEESHKLLFKITKKTWKARLRF